MSDPRNRWGETITDCAERLMRERVSAAEAEKYALTVVMALDGAKCSDRDHLIAFYRTVARIVSITRANFNGQDSAASA